MSAAVATAAPTSTPRGRVTQRHVLRSEWTKLWTLRSTRLSFIAAIVAMGALGPLVAAVQMNRWAQLEAQERAVYDSIDTGVGGYHLAQLAIGVLGVLVISGGVLDRHDPFKPRGRAPPPAGAVGEARRVRSRDLRADARRVQAQAQRRDFDEYVRETAGTGGGSAAEIAQAKDLLDAGAITQAEFEALKADALASAASPRRGSRWLGASPPSGHVLGFRSVAANPEPMASESSVRFAAPAWLRDLGFSSWLLVGFVGIILGVVWLLGQTSTIVMPVITAAVVGAVAGPAVSWLERHRVPRIGGTVLVLLGLVGIGALIFLLVFGGISANSAEISAKLNQALDKIQAWLGDLGVDNAQGAKEDVQKAAPEIRTTLLSGLAHGISGLKSLLFFAAFATLSTLFVLKDGPIMRAFINRHMGVPERVAAVVTGNVAKSLRSYFQGVTIIAAFNAVVVGIAALLAGVPLAGTIAVVTFVGAYVPYLGAWIAGAFAVLIALGTVGTDAALVMALAALLGNSVLQQLIQPFVMGATLGLNPLVVLVVTIGAGTLFGMVGLTLAAPLTSAAVHVGNELRDRSGGSAGAESAPAPSR